LLDGIVDTHLEAQVLHFVGDGNRTEAPRDFS
jgi:hypothetical protein